MNQSSVNLLELWGGSGGGGCREGRVVADTELWGNYVPPRLVFAPVGLQSGSQPFIIGGQLCARASSPRRLLLTRRHPNHSVTRPICKVSRAGNYFGPNLS